MISLCGARSHFRSSGFVWHSQRALGAFMKMGVGNNKSSWGGITNSGIEQGINTSRLLTSQHPSPTSPPTT